MALAALGPLDAIAACAKVPARLVRHQLAAPAHRVGPGAQRWKQLVEPHPGAISMLASDAAGGGVISPQVHWPTTIAPSREPATAVPSRRTSLGEGGVGRKSAAVERVISASRSSKQSR